MRKLEIVQSYHEIKKIGDAISFTSDQSGADQQASLHIPAGKLTVWLFQLQHPARRTVEYLLSQSYYFDPEQDAGTFHLDTWHSFYNEAQAQRWAIKQFDAKHKRLEQDRLAYIVDVHDTWLAQLAIDNEEA